jgi:WD40 repeat protein
MMPELPDYSGSRAVLIGTATYRDPEFPPLPAAANSLAGMRQILTDQDLCGWPHEKVTVVSDPTDVPRLVQTLRRLARDVTGVLLVYFVGHGVILRRGRLCLVLADTDAEDPDITGLEYEHVREALLDSPARLKVVILDCCYSGRAIEALSDGGVASSTDIRGVYTLTASDHTAHVPPLAQQLGTTTSFTGELLDLIRTGIPAGPELLTLGTIYSHLRHRLQSGGLPAPNQRGVDIADQFPFARNAALLPPPEDVPDPAEWAARPLPATARIGIRRRTVLLSGIGAAAAIAGGVIAIESARPPDTRPSRSAEIAATSGPLVTTYEATLAGHTQSVESVAFSLDGKVLASGSLDHTVRLWDVATGTTIAVLTGHAEGVESVAFSRDGKTLASGSDDATIRLWNVDTHACTAILIGHTNTVESVAFSPDGKTLASGSDDKMIRLWNVDTHACTAILAGHTNTVVSVAFSPDGAVLASGGYDTTIRFWDVARRTSQDTIAAHAGVIASLAFNPRAKTLASGSSDHTVRLWDVTSHTLADVLRGHTDVVYTVAFNPDGTMLASGGGDETIRLWDVTSRTVTGVLSGHTDVVYSVAFNPDGTTLASGGSDNSVRLWQIGLA